MSIDVNPGQFATEPGLAFEATQLAGLRDALAALDSSLPIRVLPIVEGAPVEDEHAQSFDSRDPNDWSRVLATVSTPAEQTVTRAIDVLVGASPAWASATQEARSRTLRTAATLLRERRYDALTLLRRECGKTWAEADAEFCEAVDFLELYATAAEDQSESPRLLDGPGERNRVHHSPRGVAAAILPWNFPIAIGLGMTTGPLVMGNTVAIKPAEQTPATGRFIAELLLDAGVPADAIAMLPGDGDVGRALVEDPRIETILFTGSREVGLRIIEAAGTTAAAQVQVKKVVAEMGGKNCIIVDATADLDAAVDGVVVSGFAFAGQKCSSGSRVLVERSVSDDFLDRLAAKVRDLRVGPADDDGNTVTGIIDHEAVARLGSVRDRAVREGTVVAEPTKLPPAGGNFVLPLVVADLPADSLLLSEEIFGPIVTVETYSDLDEALDRVDALPYALTGGIYSRSPEAIDLAIRRSPVGNFYVNRKITGAYVGRQPFGGNRMSGIGIKAGSPEYLRQFINQRVVCENTGASR